MIEELLEAFKDFMIGDAEALAKKVDAIFDKAFKERAKLSIEKSEDGTAKTKIEGNTLAVLITLAGLEKTVFEEYEVPKEVWEMVQEKVGTKEVDNG